MNAGAYGGEMSQVVSTVTVVNRNGEIMELDNGTMEFGYRTSVIQNQPFVVTKVTFRLEQGDPKQIAEKMADLAKRCRSAWKSARENNCWGAPAQAAHLSAPRDILRDN